MLIHCTTFAFSLAALTILVRVVCVRTKRQCFATSRGCQPAHSQVRVRDPFIGLDFVHDCFFGKGLKDTAEETHELFQQYGKTFVVERCTWTTVYTCDSRNVQHVLATAFEDFDIPSLRVSAMSSLFGLGIFAQSGASWRHTRKALRPCFTQANMAPLGDVLERHFQAMMRHIPEDQPLDLQPMFFFLTMDIATEFLMGKSAGMMENPGTREQQFASDYLSCCLQVVKRMRAGPLQHLMRVDGKAKQRVLGYIDSFINEALREKSPGVTYSALHELAAMAEDREALRDQVLHVLLASRDTTASLLSNLFFMLAKRPDVYEKLRGEVLEVGSAPPTASQLKEMKYLKWCIQESLRLHPVIPSNGREAVRDAILPRGGGPDGTSPLFVKKGTIVMYSPYSMHRDEQVFGHDPDAFIPERWEGLRPGWGYLPFNGGPRICIGQQFAMIETQYIVARMVQTFARIESLDDGEWREQYALAMTCENGVHVKLNCDEKGTSWT